MAAECTIESQIPLGLLVLYKNMGINQRWGDSGRGHDIKCPAHVFDHQYHPMGIIPGSCPPLFELLGTLYQVSPSNWPMIAQQSILNPQFSLALQLGPVCTCTHRCKGFTTECSAYKKKGGVKGGGHFIKCSLPTMFFS